MIMWIPKYTSEWFIILHHSLTKDSKTVSWEAIDRYHKNELGFMDIGYHYGIELIGEEYQTLMGRPLGQEGAHTKQARMNKKSIGICFVGNYDQEAPHPYMYNAGINLIAGLCYSLKIDPEYKIKGHCEYADKSCPGIYFNIDIIKYGVAKII